MSHDSSQHDSHPTQSDFLSGPQIIPRRIKPGMTIAELIDQQFQAYNSARLNEAAHLFAEEMLAPEKDVTIGLTMAGALTPAGLGGCILTLMEYGFVDFIISTGANLYHDMHHALAMAMHRGDFRLDDTKLQEEGVIRIYDILFADKVLLDTDAFVRECLNSLPNTPIATSVLHHHLGTQLLKAGVKPEYSSWPNSTPEPKADSDVLLKAIDPTSGFVSNKTFNLEGIERLTAPVEIGGRSMG